MHNTNGVRHKTSPNRKVLFLTTEEVHSYAYGGSIN